MILLRIQKKFPKFHRSLKYGSGKATVCDILKRKDEIEGYLRKISAVRENDMSVPVNFLTWISVSRCCGVPHGCLIIFRSRRPGWWHSSQWTCPTFAIEWPVCFTWWYRGIWRQFDNRINFQWWMGIRRLASRIYSRYHFVVIAW